MGTKARAKGFEYRIEYGGHKPRIVIAKNIREAGAIAKRLYPKSRLLQVSRKPSAKGKEYESYYISR